MPETLALQDVMSLSALLPEYLEYLECGSKLVSRLQFDLPVLRKTGRDRQSNEWNMLPEASVEGVWLWAWQRVMNDVATQCKLYYPQGTAAELVAYVCKPFEEAKGRPKTRYNFLLGGMRAMYDNVTVALAGDADAISSLFGKLGIDAE
jgi:hypothetical protein